MKHLLIITCLLLIPYLGISQTVEQINKPTVAELDQITPFSDGLAAVRKGDQWGFIDEEGQLVIGFRNDLVWNKNPQTDNPGVEGIGYPQFMNGRCVVREVKEDGIARYGFIDKKGNMAIPAEFLNVSPFSEGHAVGIYESKSLRGKNTFQLKIYDYDFTEVVVNEVGEMIWPIQERQNIVMSGKLYKLPELQAKMISDHLLAVKDKANKWKIVKPKF
ncbi:WG repeat-containing protein [Zobellia galactanivorans]|uniref:WG repeat-containing protein n=1 Tax=Zobellia galactanivorans (strain DSM 12802 / CCUG 47099 / CIP 106680 / NCIMB 13871 / Dsij) TaxID=63186 RepID=UPI0026E3555A|nr:WG repeat-containing protein [Zobellia galactanivorans]MDO6807605.1 WG repeat-containing protein [Zobellia galactanivorans]